MSKRENMLLQKRLDKAAKETVEMLNNGYSQKTKTISFLAANLYSILFAIPFVFVFFNLFAKLNNVTVIYIWNYLFSLSLSQFILFAVLLYLLTVLHELIHAVFNYIFNGHKMEDVQLGIMKMTPFCSCQVPLKRWEYMIMILMPALSLSTVLLIVAFIMNDPFALWLATLMFIGGSGDFSIFIILLSEKKHKEIWIIDSPDQCGCDLFYKD